MSRRPDGRNIVFRLNDKSFLSYLRARFVLQIFDSFTAENEFNWTGFKTVVAAPIVEELVYRALIFNIYNASEGYLVFVLPLYFGFAHAHPVIAKIGTPELKTEIARAHLKLAYTTLFGAYSGWVFVRTKDAGFTNIWGAIMLHAQCNYFGLPSFHILFDRSVVLKRRVIFGFLYLLGILLFWLMYQFCI